MMSILCTTDVRTIKEIIKDDYDMVIFDGCPSFEDFEPDVENSLWFILYQDSDTAGLIKLENLNLTTWIPHIVIKKEFRGEGSEHWGQLVVKYMKERIKDINFLVMTPYETAKKYAERMGFNLIGIMPKSVKKNGELMDQYILSGDCS
jgi:RimJ/RimL family protein N-acetyltransferase